MPRGRLAALLWPDRDETRARANLRQLIHRIRRHGDLLEGDPLKLGAHVVLEGAWGRPATDRLESAAVAHEQGRARGALADADPFELPDAADLAELEEWFTAERERHRAAAWSRTQTAYRSACRDGRWQDAVAAAQSRLAIDPRSEEAYVDLMTARLEGGDARGAMESYRRLREMLERSFDATPGPGTVALARRAAAAAASATRRESVAPPAAIGSSGLAHGVARLAEAGGWMPEGAKLLRLAAEATVDPSPRGRILVDLAWLEHQLGHNPEAEVCAREAVGLLAAEGGDADGWFVLGSIARHRGAGEASREYFERALERTRAQDDAQGRLALHLNLALVADSLDDGAAARSHYLSALRLAQERGDTRAEATVLNNLAHALLEDGQLARASLLLRRVRATATDLNDRHLTAHVLDGLARAEAGLGRANDARALASIAFATAREVGDVALQVEVLLTLARVRESIEGRHVAGVVAREALRLAWRHGYLPGTLEAALALATVQDPQDASSAELLNAILDDARVPPSLLSRADAAATMRGIRRFPGDLPRAVAAALL